MRDLAVQPSHCGLGGVSAVTAEAERTRWRATQNTRVRAGSAQPDVSHQNAPIGGSWCTACGESGQSLRVARWQTGQMPLPAWRLVVPEAVAIGGWPLAGR
jgi:hypothetical protein